MKDAAGVQISNGNLWANLAAELSAMQSKAWIHVYVSGTLPPTPES